MKNNTLHFSLNSNMANLLANIAREKIEYNYNIKEGMDVFRKSLNISEDLIIKLLSGKEYYMTVNDDKVSMDIKTRNGEMDEKSYTIWDCNNLVERYINDFYDNIKFFSTVISELNRYFSKYDNRNIDIITKIDIKDIFNHSDEEIKDMLFNKFEEYKENIDIDSNYYGFSEKQKAKNVFSCIKIIGIFNKWIEENIKKINIIEWLENNRFIEKNDEKEKIIYYMDDIKKKMESLISYINNGKIIKNNSVEEYLKIENEIDKTLNNYKIGTSQNIMDNYSAGWLSPEGKFYGLNGKISNLLHLKIADKLKDIKIIPEDNKNNPENWLTNNGWVKIHENNVTFYGGFNLNKIYDLTEIQVDEICRYIDKFYNGNIICYGNGLHITTSKFKNTEPIMRRNFFNI